MKNYSTARQLTLTALFTTITVIGSFIRIPLLYSSFTLQFFCAAMAGILLGPNLGSLSQALYLILGLLGLPIFASGGGINYVFQPTFGFLLASIPATWTIGHIAKQKRDRSQIIFACTIGLSVLYLIGLPYMAMILRFYLHEHMNFYQLLLAGVFPFLPGDAIKVVLCAILCPRIETRVQRMH